MSFGWTAIKNARNATRSRMRLDNIVVDATDPQDKQNTYGGWYELAAEFETSDSDISDAAVRQLSRLANVERVAGGNVLNLPNGRPVVCTFAEVVSEGSVWVILGLPQGSLVRVDPRIRDYPFTDDDGASWRRPLDSWLASLAIRLFDVMPFSLALVGHEVSGLMSAAQLAAGLPAEHDHLAIVTVAVNDGPKYYPATF